MACNPVSNASKSSVNAILLAAFEGSRLVIVYSTVTVPPGSTGSSVKVLLKAIKLPFTSNISVAGGRTTVVPSIVAVRLEVTLVCVPEAAPAGTRTLTSKEQEVPADTSPLIKTKKLVPNIIFVAPQGIVGNGASATKPGNTAPRLSVKTILVASSEVVLSIVNLSVTRSPGIVGSSTNSFVSVSPPIRRSSVAASLEPVCPSTVELSVLVVLR